MLRRLLLPLDGSPSSQRAIEFALRMTKRLQATQADARPIRITGMSIVDVPTIAAPQAMPIGGAYYKKHRDEVLVADANLQTRSFLTRFEEQCQRAGVESDTLHVQGMPWTEIEQACRTHDVVVIGKDTNFHFETSGQKCETAIQLLRDHPSPLIGVDSQVPEGGDVLVAYDRSQPASRTLHMFVLMQLAQLGQVVHVVSVDSSREAKARSLCVEASQLLQSHDVVTEMHPIQSNKCVSEILLGKVDELGIQMVVMGSYGHTGIQTWFFGSTTNEMFASCPVPLFLYH